MDVYSSGLIFALRFGIHEEGHLREVQASNFTPFDAQNRSLENARLGDSYHSKGIVPGLQI